MEPKGSSPERMPNLTPQTGEFSVPTPEQVPGDVERQESSPEHAAERTGEHHQAVTSASPAPIALPTPIPQSADDSTGQATDDDAPLTASDDDLIEKEWVDKAKKIITDTKDDPHMREKQVGKLQADYLRKRYGKELGEPAE